MNKHITIYDAMLKKNKSYIFNVNNFKDENDMNEHIKKLREEQRIKNKEFRNNKNQSQIINNDNQIINNDNQPQIINNNMNKQFNNINILNTYDIKLDPNTGNSCVILGSSKRGKSTLMMNIYNKYYGYDKNNICTLFSINSHIGVYKSDKNLLVSDCFNGRSQKYIKLQKYINGKTKNKYNFLNMFDDIIDMKYSKLINQLILTYRNSNISTIMCLQYGYLLSKMNRANVNNIIIFGSNTNESIEDLIKTYLKPYFNKLGYKTFDEQMGLFKYVTNDFGFIYIHPKSDNITFHKLIM